jgi:catechol 2,3-dioxygenase-like lactoylglutathione lyase family enzyme
MHEIHIEVEDLEKSLALYTKLLPHKDVTHWADGSAAAIIFEDGSAFGLWKKGKHGIHDGRGGKHVHYAFQIRPDEYQHYHDKIKKQGLVPLEHTWNDDAQSVYFFDYDGHQGEFMTKDWLGRQVSDKS